MKWFPQVMVNKQAIVLDNIGSLLTSLNFYLAGGTAVALQLGHRMSKDLDWFTQEPLQDPLALAQSIRENEIAFTTAAVSRGTLHGAISGVRVSFLHYGYRLLKPLSYSPDNVCRLASLDDLACMKLSAVAQRGSKKDFVDIYALGMQHRPLAEMLELYGEKYDIKDIAHLLYALTYFDDADKERLPKMLWPVRWSEIKREITCWVNGVTG
ncbi:MAG: nucleotidyl transferase AbiEii/AbiGii toxin family protein [bacterium]|nr:nucleotidyl transferase AbiEii/AbiGii toxin family protein [bacterium]